jgi:adenylate kinase family enzyme
MRRVIIFGNSGSGKSTLASIFKDQGLSHLDLDTLAWEMNPELTRRKVEDSAKEILKFISANESWVIEGCYSDLIEFAIDSSNEMIFMNLSVDSCIKNAKSRPWEPHKYGSSEAQDSNLGMLINWIRQYPERDDTFSKVMHEKLYAEYQGKKSMCTSNQSST